jgi:hypothetical protein
MKRAASHPALLAPLALALLGAACGPAYLDPADAGPDFLVQGEYAAAGAAYAAQLVALGSGRFELVLLADGLPGAGWDGQTRASALGERRGKAVHFAAAGIEARHEGGRLAGHGPDGRRFDLARVERTSQTLGARPPPGAVVLFDGGRNATDGSVDERGHLQAGATSNEAFGDLRLHVEFRTPFMPDSRGQARGNSGVYLQGRYEVQVLDSFGLEGAWNECGGIYKIAAPNVNMALPPLAWQTYDIDFSAARFDASGSRTAPARITVRHNGVVIHDDVELPGPTGQGAPETPEPGPLYLQDHWNPVVFRNVWLVEG